MAIASFTEDISSHIPAVHLLMNLGYEYITPEQTIKDRDGKKSRVVLVDILKDWLAKNNEISFKGETHNFSDKNIQNAIDHIVGLPFESLMANNEKIYDHLSYGTTLEQTINGDTKSFSLQYIDFKNPENNVFHITDEYEVERRLSNKTRRPDIVLFVNGIPLAVIEAKRPDMKDPMKQAISQFQRNQKSDEIPELFTYSQVVMGVSQNLARYATAGTPPDYWAVWKEEDSEYGEAKLKEIINKPLTSEQKEDIFKEKTDVQRRYAEKAWKSGDRLPSPQDKAIFSLLTPKRLLELTYGFIVFDNKIKKVCRYQQYFAIGKTVERVTNTRGDEQRKGGVIWHTTGSGKSLTMVMMAKALVLEKEIKNPRVILVTDRIDLDDQIKNTFKACGKDVAKASTGSHLLELLESKKNDIVTTVINKFEKVSENGFKDLSNNVFILIDESHRSNYGTAAALMRKSFPNACYIGFTGTPLLKKDKSTAKQFGGFIHKYTMNQAVKDKAVVPLLYEGRMSELRGDRDKLDKWFERITAELTPEQQADLKKKFKREEEIMKSDQRLMEISFDIRDHYLEKYMSTGYKGMLACSSKENAIRYKRYFDEFKDIKTDVIISGPDDREGHSDLDESNVSDVIKFWKAMMNQYGGEKRYTETIINNFKKSDEPHLLIVVDKLLTGFDAPNNSVLYVDKRLKEHNLLQAIARVNRVSEGKPYGLIVDYRGIFGEINDAIDTYAALENEGFDKEDVEGTLVNVEIEIKELPQRHTNLWEVFKEVENKHDIESMQRHLEPGNIRKQFYGRLREYSNTLGLALSNAKFQDTTDKKTIANYSKDLKDFVNLRASVKQRFAETIDYSSYEKQIRNIINKHIGADQVEVIIEQTSIFDVENFDEELEKIHGDAAKADTIASRIKRSISEKMDEDPALYMKLSEMINEAIRDHRKKRLDDQEYLNKVSAVMDEFRGVTEPPSIPEAIRENQSARAFYGLIEETEKLNILDQDQWAKAALKVNEIIENHKVRDFEHNQDVQNKMLNDLDDYFYSLKGRFDLDLTAVDLDYLLERIIRVAIRRAEL